MQRKLALAFIGFALIPLLVISQLLMVYIHKDQTFNLAEDASKMVRTELEFRVRERLRDVQAFTTGQGLLASTVENLETYCNLVVASHPDYRLVMMVDGDGVVTGINTKDAAGKALESTSLLGKSFERSSWFQRALTSQDAFIESPKDLDFLKAVHGVDTLAVMPVAKSMRNQDGHVTGVWVIFTSTDFLSQVLSSTAKNLNAVGTFEIYDHAGQVMASFNNLGGQEMGSHETSTELISFAGQDWYIQSHVQGISLLDYLQTYFWPLLVFIGLIVMYGFVASRRITIPLQRLIDAAELLARGQAKVLVPYLQRKDDYGRLARVLNSLQPAPVGELFGSVAGQDPAQVAAQQIDNTVQLINGLSAQANMLALNASMEAVNAHHLDEVAEKANELAQRTSYNSQELLKKLNEIKSVCDEIQSKKSGQVV